MIDALTGELALLALRWPIAAALLTALLRSLMLLAGALLAEHLLRAEPARIRRTLWTATLAGLAIVGALAILEASGLKPTAERWVAATDPPWRAGVVAALWVVPAALMLLRLHRGRRASRRLVEAAVPVRDESWLRELASVAAESGLAGRFELRRSTSIACPTVCAVTRPCLVIPDAFLQEPPELRRAVLLHELEHLRARDVMTRQLGLLTRALLWFSPATWIALRHARIESESAGDERALESGIRPSLYAEHLASLALDRPRAEWAGVAAALGGAELEARLANLSRYAAPDRRRRPSPRAWLAAGLAAAVFAAALAVHLPRPRVQLFVSGPTASGPAAE